MRNSFEQDVLSALKLAEIAAAYHGTPPKMAKCLGCGEAKMCRTTNVGFVCRSCIDRRTGNDELWKKLVIVPKLDAEAFVIKGKNGDYITVNGNLHVFHTRLHAEISIKVIQREIPNVRNLVVAKELAKLPFLYAFCNRLNYAARARPFGKEEECDCQECKDLDNKQNIGGN